MKRTQAVIKNGYLILKLPMEKPMASKSGKTHVVASTRGFRRVGVLYKGRHEVYVAANACIYLPTPEPKT